MTTLEGASECNKAQSNFSSNVQEKLKPFYPSHCTYKNVYVFMNVIYCEFSPGFEFGRMLFFEN